MSHLRSCRRRQIAENNSVECKVSTVVTTICSRMTSEFFKDARDLKTARVRFEDSDNLEFDCYFHSKAVKVIVSKICECSSKKSFYIPYCFFSKEWKRRLRAGLPLADNEDLICSA